MNPPVLRIEPEIAGASVVLLGDFNPAVFTPAWFALNNLLRAPLAANARLDIAHAQQTEFEADWLHLQVTPSHFTASTNQAPYSRLRDLVAALFWDILPHTPLRSLGINRSVHFQVQNLEQRDRLGRRLAPTEVWGDWSEDLGTTGKQGGMTSLTMTQVSVSGRPSGDRINARVESSALLDNPETGVFVQVNDHYVSRETEAAAYLTNSLAKNFESSLRNSDRIIDRVMSLSGQRWQASRGCCRSGDGSE